MNPTASSPIPSSGAVFDGFLRELVMAWKQLAAYPAGHPLRQAAMASAYRELKSLLELGKPVDLGVARDGLSWGEQRADSVGSRQLAAVLYQSNVAVLRFVSGLSASELESFLLVLRPGPGETSTAEGLAGRLSAAGVVHVELKRADFSLVRSTDGLDDRHPPRTDLWDRILRWHLEGRPDLAIASGGQGLEAVLSWVRGTLKQAEDLSTPTAQLLLRRLTEAVEADLAGPCDSLGPQARVRQVSELIRALPVALREPLIQAAVTRLMTAESDGPALTAFARSIPRSALLGALGRLRASGLRFPPLLGRLIDDLAPRMEGSEAGQPPASAPVDLDVEIFRRRRNLFIEIPQSFAAGAVGDFESELRSLEPRATLQRLIRTLLALVSVQRPEAELEGPVARLEDAYVTLLTSGHPGAAYALVLELGDQAARPPAHEGACRALKRFTGARAVAVLVAAIRGASETETEDLRRLVQRLGNEPIRQLLLALGEVEDRSVRRALFNFLRQHPRAVVTAAPQVLLDSRWYVVRNVLSLLQEVGDRRAAESAQGCLTHPDPRVRIEALKVVGRKGSADLRSEVLAMLGDSEERIVRQAMQLAGELKLREAVGPLLELLKPLDLGGKQRDLRLMALRVLGEIGDPAALDELKRFFSGVASLVSAEERRAAYLSLAGYPAAEREPWVSRGARLRDSEIQRACQALLEAPGGFDG